MASDTACSCLYQPTARRRCRASSRCIVRKAYGGAYLVMDSKSIGTDLSFAWPTAELAVMGPEGAVEIVARRACRSRPPTQCAGGPDPTGDYAERFTNPYIAAERGYIDDVIDPAETRTILARSLEMLSSKREDLPKRKHGNIPL